MDQVILPQCAEDQIIFVLTADTLGVDATGQITGKPVDMADGIAKIKAAQGGTNYCGTAFCLEKKILSKGVWHTQERIMGYANAEYEFIVPDELIESYLRISGALEAAGAIKIEEGPQFLKSVRGSYSAIVGLPMYELWHALVQIGFFIV